MGNVERVLLSNSSIFLFKPFESDRTSAIPIMPIPEAKEVRAVLHFFVEMFVPDNFRAVRKLIPVFLRENFDFTSMDSGGLLSETTSPSLSLTILSAYLSANS